MKPLQSDKEELLNTLLFTVFHFFMRDCYTAADRSLIKELLYVFEPLIKSVIMGGQSDTVGFYLTVFEREIGVTHKLEDTYNIRVMPIANCTELEKYGVVDALDKSRILELQRISDIEKTSRNVVICISGFLTEDVEKKESWKHVIHHFRHSEVFALNWTSLTMGNLFNDGHYEVKKSKGRYWNPIRTWKKQFSWAKEQTRLVGTMLALFLLRTDFSNDRSVTLLGHSLGTVIILHCLNILHQFYKKGNKHAGRIINDLYLWGGAAVLNPTGKLSEIQQNSMVCSIANGRVNNCYTDRDQVLGSGFMWLISDYKPIGIIPIFEEMPSEIADISSKYKRAHNYDVSEESPGHTLYNEAANLILEKIRQSY